MQSRIRVLSIALTFVWVLMPMTVFSQELDFVLSHPEFNKVLVDNDRVRVIEFTLEAGEKEPLHSHPDRILYVVEGGIIRAEYETGEPVEFDVVTGTAMYRAADGTKHTAENISDARVRIIITEFK